MKLNRKWKMGALAVLLVLAIMVMPPICACLMFRFDQEEWLLAKPPSSTRRHMVGNLLSDHTPVGLKYSEVEKLLGKPDCDNVSNTTNRFVSYYLAPYFLDYWWLQLRLDNQGVVTQAVLLHD